MTTQPDGGPAYPHGPLGDSFTGETGYTSHQFPAWLGMSLRDWFAGKESLAEWDDQNAFPNQQMCEALAGRPQPTGGYGGCKTPETWLAMLQWEADWRAALKYIRADAVLKARDR